MTIHEIYDLISMASKALSRLTSDRQLSVAASEAQQHLAKARLALAPHLAATPYAMDQKKENSDK